MTVAERGRHRRAAGGLCAEHSVRAGLHQTELTEFAEPLVHLGELGARRDRDDDLRSDAQGNLWFAQHHSNEIGRMSPEGVYTGYPVPTPNSVMDSLVVDEARRVVWVTSWLGVYQSRIGTTDSA